MNPAVLWTGFISLIVILLVLDLFVFHRQAHEVKLKEAMIATVFWIFLALLFNVGVYYWMGSKKALEFLTGYLIEKSLSVDNIFVFIIIFSYFKVPSKFQHKILFWGIMGALIMRAAFILTGVALIQRFNWIIYVFGAFLVYTGIKMAFQGEGDVHPEKNPVLRLARKFIPVSHVSDGSLITRVNGKLMATSFFIVLLVVESTDVVFAMDSIPAILAISYDPFIVFTSNVFAILGLRALYFALAGIMQMFHYLKYGLSVVLVFVGIKMIIAHDIYKIPIFVSLTVIASILTISIVASYMFPKKAEEKTEELLIR